MFFKYFTNLKTKTKKNELAFLQRRTPFYKPFLALLPSLTLLILFTVIPFFIALKFAFTSPVDIRIQNSDSFNFRAFENVWSDPVFLLGVRNSMLSSVITLPITFVIALIISSAIVHVYRKWARGFWQTVFFLPYVTNSIAISIAFFYLFYSNGGIVNKILGSQIQWLDNIEVGNYNAIAVIIIHRVWSGLAFNILILTVAMLGVDPTLYKVAAVDGASKWKQFFRITLPSISRTSNFLITVGIINGIKVFPLGLFQNRTDDAIRYQGTTIMIYIFDAVKAGRFGQAGAASLSLFGLGIALSVVMKQGLALLIKAFGKWGEHRVYNKVKNSTVFK
ncbi:carbohydrate ABC transporter permease [Mycoplasmopsis pulmonis]|nr:sugar ABC transporter permease [Mycoplasmopsis pulmonis]MDZ7293724.1 sugar ABC transporter permease [Mycoplasmopsis pulmonis]VEU67819.1 sn-glycerol-3-phosphate transport system permease protein ugpA [Mycoplasmopsis pulmonis]